MTSCPTCGRTQIDLIGLAKKVEKAVANIDKDIHIAVMGCVVNGPGEAEGADVAVFAGDRKGIIYVQGERVATVSEDEIRAMCWAGHRSSPAATDAPMATARSPR